MPHRNGTGIALLADPTRRQVVAMLGIAPRRPSELALRLSLSRAAIARQLRLLEGAGLIVTHRVRTDGRAVLYTIHPRRHGAITAWLAGTEVGRGFAEPAPAAPVSPSPAQAEAIAEDGVRGGSRQAERLEE